MDWDILILLLAALAGTPGVSAAIESVSLNPTTLPTAGQPGIKTLNLIATDFPDGKIRPSDVSVLLQPVSSGPDRYHCQLARERILAALPSMKLRRIFCPEGM